MQLGIYADNAKPYVDIGFSHIAEIAWQYVVQFRTVYGFGYKSHVIVSWVLLDGVAAVDDQLAAGGADAAVEADTAFGSFVASA